MESVENAGDRKKRKASGSENRQRLGLIGVRVTDAERAEIKAAAARAGLNVGAYIREQVLAEPKARSKKPRFDIAELSQLLGQLGRVGGNIHQIVKRMNYGEGVESAALVSALAKVEESAAAIMQAMGRRFS